MSLRVGLRVVLNRITRRVDLGVDSRCLVVGQALGLWVAGKVAASTVSQDMTHVEVVNKHLIRKTGRLDRPGVSLLSISH